MQYYEYPKLANLVHGYFHQDYDIISENPEEIFAAYKQRELPGNTRILINDIKRFLNDYDNKDIPLAESFKRIFRPDNAFEGWNGFTTREWLLKAIEILS